MQAMDRAFRIGQRRNVHVYRLIAAGTVEEPIYSRQVSAESPLQAESRNNCLYICRHLHFAAGEAMVRSCELPAAWCDIMPGSPLPPCQCRAVT